MGKKSTRRKNRNRRRKSRKRYRKRKRRKSRRNRRRRRQRGGGCIKNEYTPENAFPPGGMFQPGKVNGLNGGYYYGLNENPSLLGFPHSTTGEMGVSQNGGRRRRRRRNKRSKRRQHKHSKRCRHSRKSRRRNQRGGHIPIGMPSTTPLSSLSELAKAFLPSEIIDIGRDIGTETRNVVHKYEGEATEVGGNVMNQPDLPVLKEIKHKF